ncbi:MAG: O-antigen ligase family protein [Clostridia bacterium]|nr:O-antigen ligase family protein [Clostridia bacterium]
MNILRENKINIILTLAYVILYALLKNSMIILLFFALIIPLEIYYLVNKKIDHVICQALMLVPLMDITCCYNIPFANIYNSILAIYLMLFYKDIKLKKFTFCIYLLTVSLDLIRYLININGEKSVIEIIGLPVFYLNVFLIIIIPKFAQNYIKIKKYSYSFVVGTLLTILYGFIIRFMAGGLKFALINTDISTRNTGASGDPNYFGMYICISIAILLMFAWIEKKKIYKTIYISIFLILLGLSSSSRMFYILSAFIILILLFIMLKSLFSKKIWLCFLTIFIFGILLFANREMIMTNFNYLSSRFEMADITSGRNTIAKQYNAYLEDNLTNNIFGIGIPEYHIRSGVKEYAHNLYLEVIICHGIIGGIICIFVLICIIQKHFKVTKFVVFLPFIIILISGLAVNFIEVDSFYLLYGLIYSYIIMNCKEKLKEVNSNEKILIK